MKGCMCTSFNFARHCMLWKTSLLFLTSINKPHLSRRYAKTFWPIPGLISCVYFMKESTIDVTSNGAHLRIPEKKAGLDVMQSHPQHRTCFAQYQASSAALGVTKRWELLSHAQNAIMWLDLSMTSRSFLNVLQLSLGNRCYDTSSHNRHMLWISIHMSGYSEALEVPEVLVAIAWTRYGVSNEACGHKTQAHVCVHMPQKARLPFFLESMLIDTHTYAPMCAPTHPELGFFVEIMCYIWYLMFSW